MFSDNSIALAPKRHWEVKESSGSWLRTLAHLVLHLRIRPVKDEPQGRDHREYEVASLRPNRTTRQPIGTVETGVDQVAGQKRSAVGNGVEIALAPIPRHVKADGPP